MGCLRILFQCVVAITFIHGSRGCSINGVSNWLLPQNRRIDDFFEGNIFNEPTTNIDSITGVTFREGLNGGPYLDVALVNSNLAISTTAAYRNFENLETAQSIGFSINFRCAGGSSAILVFNFDVIDSNNNDPVFNSNNYEYKLPLPIPPNFAITNCINDFFVRDIDLTTERIDFTLEGSTLFDISYDGSTVPKEFRATLRTTTFIRSIAEPIILTITATDVDRTPDPPRTTSTTVTISADNEFSLPEEPVFSQPFYIVTYTREHEIVSTVSITLSQGYDSEVIFSLEGEYSQYFNASVNGNQVTLTVESELDLEALQQNEIYLIVKAEREYTSGATATIILQLPEARELRFEKSSYIGTLKTNIVNLEDVILNAGFDNDVTFQLTGHYSELFNVRIIHSQNRVIIETNEEISENILQENNFLVLTLIATAPLATTASTIIFVEVIKDDYVTPVFSQNIYTGMYVSNTEVIFANIAVTQGYDETVTYSLAGEYAEYFTLHPNLNNVTLIVNSTIPEDVIFNEKVLLFNILAEKPRTVGANAAVALKFGTEFTEATVLKFSKSTYNGQLDNGELTVEDIILDSGYTPQITFILSGDFQQSFTISNTNNVVKIALSSTASLEDLNRNKFVILEIEASRERAISVTTSVIIDISKIEIINPVFARPFYSGSYTQENGLTFQEEMTLQTGYDSSVTFSLEGEHSQWFTLQQNENSVMLISNQVSPLPQDVLDQNNYIIFAVVANKPDTIGGRAAIHIDLPKETIYLQFEKNSYRGRIENGNLHLEEIRLPGVALSSVELNLLGDYDSYFQITIESEAIVIRLLNIPEEVIENNNFITLNLEASQTNAIKGHTTIVLDIIRAQIIPPIFERTYYFGEYSKQEGLSFVEVISLVRGFDNTVSFALEGNSSQWFNLVKREENSLTLTLQNSNLHELTDEDVLVFTVVAHKTNTESARATIVISLKEENTLFDKVLYTGNLEDNNVVHETITLTNFNGSTVLIQGEHSSLFESRLANGIVTVLATASAVFPSDLTHITLTLHADSVSAVLVLDVVDTRRNAVLKFEQTSYVGSINNNVITLSQITLSEGYSDDVSFSLQGALATYFTFSQNGASIIIVVNGTIPKEVLAANKIVVLDLTASAPNAESAIAVIVLDVVESETPPSEQLVFDRPYYTGHYSNGTFRFNQIISLASGHDITTVFRLEGAFSEFFYLQPSENGVILVLNETIPSSVLEANQVLVLDVLAEINSGATGRTVVFVTHDYGSVIEDNVSFDKVLYTGILQGSNVVHETITLTNYNGLNVLIQGEYSSMFESRLENGVVNIFTITSAVIPSDLTHITLTLHAGSVSAVLVLDADTGKNPELRFEQTSYVGSIDNNVITLNPITLSEGYSEDVSFTLGGALASYFRLSQNGASVTLEVNGTIPEEVLAATKLILLDLTATAPNAESAIAVIVLDVVESETPPSQQLVFDRPYYTGHYSNGIFEFNQIISLASVHNFTTVFRLEGAFSEFFYLQPSENGVILVLNDSIPSSVLEANQVLVVDVFAEISSGATGRTVVFVTHDYETNEAFDKVLYNGNIENGIVDHETITISGYSGISVQILGEYQSSFQASLQNGVVTVSLSPSAVLPANLTHVPLTLQAGRASAVLLLDVVGSESPSDEAFDKVLYSGRIENGVVSHETITISEYSGTNIQVIGAYQTLFQATLQNGIVTVSLSPSAVFPADLARLPLTLQAGRATAVLLLDVIGSGSETEEMFDQILYNGRIENGVVTHDTITITGYSGTNVQIIGEHQSSFQASLQNGVVTVSLSPSAVLPANLTHVPLTLQAGRASAVLLLDVIGSGPINPPDVTFSKSSYYLWADVEQTGVVGRVEATASNNEAIAYSLQFDDDFLQNVITINNQGEIFLSNSIQSGVHSFTVTATTQNSRDTATASVLLRVEALPICDSKEGLPPLIVLERDEEQPHRNLVVFNETNENCRYELSNSWPADQSWLYIDTEGLHTTAIDREDPSIAFMTLSQIQVELTLSCDSDEISVAKRSLNTGILETDSYNYGSNKWVLVDTIEYNPRRSLVNLIVNDINDNPPIFIGKENEPIYVGYPVPEIEDRILPRALVELKATDADIGENAAIMYWSSEESIVVSPRTGFVHVRNNVRLENNSRFTVYATDLNGNGLNGALDILVKMLQTNQIAVITVQNSFLDDESSVLNDLSNAVGYEIKVLRAVVISLNNEDITRTRRNLANNADVSLQLYIYGLDENEPVDVVRLTGDITNSNAVSVNVASVLSLEDHLESPEICPILENDVGLLVATIVLAVLLLLVIVTIILYFIIIRKYKLHLKWRKNKDYDEFSNNNEDGSRNNTFDPIPKVEISSKPRLDIEELKRSERRLQERLDIPIVSIGSETSEKDIKEEPRTETIVDIVTPVPQLPIVIQSIDKLKDSSEESDEDEFGEKKGQRRKSVVTFNENVEKIIHLEDLDEPDTPEPTTEVYKL